MRHWRTRVRQPYPRMHAPSNGANLIEDCPDPAFPTMVSGGYSSSPSVVTSFAATIDGPTGDNLWQVTVVNTSGQTVALTMYTICAKG